MDMKKKIFIVEDDAIILYGMSAKMSDAGFLITQDSGTSDIKDVWVKINSKRPDFIVLDLIVPGYDGFDLLRKIKQDPVLFQIPVFVFTNMTDTDTRLKCDAVGADYFFIKTEFNIDEFVDKIKVIVQNLEKIK